MTLMKAKKPLALLLALLAALSLLGTTALAAGLPEETIAAQTELCGEDCGHTHEEVFSHTEHTEESLPEPEEIAVPVATPLLEQPEPEAGQPSDTSGVIPGSGIYWELNEYGWLMLSGNGSCPTFVSPDDQPWAAVREQITQVWFEDMDALCIPSLAYWFTGCTALTMAEIPYTTPVIGAAAFADCPSLRQIQLYYSGTFTIVPGAFSTGSLTPLLVLFIPEYDSVLGTLAAYDWTEDRRAAYFEDVYGITLLATGYCSNCKRTCSYTVEYEQWTNSEHCVRHWCSNCGYDQAGGVNGEAHSFRSGVCSKCGYSNGSGGGGGGGGNVCYHSSTRTSWSGCDWYEYCRSCGLRHQPRHLRLRRVGVLQQQPAPAQLRLLRLRRGNLSLRLPFGFNAVRAVQRSPAPNRAILLRLQCDALLVLFRPYLHLRNLAERFCHAAPQDQDLLRLRIQRV